MKNENIKFKSNIDWWFHLVVAIFLVIPLICFYIVFLSAPLWDYFVLIIGVVVAFTFVFQILPMYLFTFYTLKDKTLCIHSGICCHRRIPYSNILKVTEVRHSFSSAALSSDRLEIQYSTGLGVIYISPKNKQEFIDRLNDRIAQAILNG